MRHEFRVRPGGFDPGKSESGDCGLAPVANEIVLERQRPVLGLNDRGDVIVAHRQDCRADSELSGDGLGDGRQALAPGEGLGAKHMHREIAVAEIEPIFAAQLSERRHEIPAFVVTAPTALLIRKVGERVDERVGVRANPQSQMGEIVSGVGDDGQVLGRQNVRKTQSQFRAADTAGEC